MALQPTLISVDLETGGTTLGASPIIAVGACRADVDWAARWAELPSVLARARAQIGPFEEPDLFYCELRPPAWAPWSEAAVAFHGLTLPHLLEHGTPQSDALAAFVAWVRRLAVPPGEARLVSHNAAFDWAHLSAHLVRYDLDDPFDPFPACTKNIARGRFRDRGDASSGQTALAPVLGMPRHLGKHDALADALSQAVLYQRLMA